MTDLSADPNAIAALGAFDDATRAVVRAMLADGFHVAAAWGPVQMAVAHIELARAGQRVEWHTERGFPDPARVRHDAPALPDTSLAVATFAWARSRGDDGELRAPDVAVPARAADVTTMVASHWREVLDWLPDADDVRLQRIASVWWGSWPFSRLFPKGEAAIAEWGDRVEAAAAE